MANKLISDLSSAAILVTDLLEHQPIAGPPSKKGTVTALFSDAGGNLAIDRDNRLLINSSGGTVLDWENLLAFINQAGRKLIRSDTSESVNWSDNQLLAVNGVTIVLDWSAQQPSSGAQTAGVLYDATTKVMIQEAYDALRAYGLLS